MNILVVDDHPLTMEGYILSLSQGTGLPDGVIFLRAKNGDAVLEQIETIRLNGMSIALALIDYSIPADAHSKIKNGGDVVQYLRAIWPQCRTLIITAHTESLIIYDIFKNIRPDGLAIKNDVTPTSLGQMVQRVLAGDRVQSPTVNECQEAIIKKELLFDDTNRLILMYLSKGYKINELERHIPLADITIRKRIAKMRKIFGASDVAELIRQAFDLGYV